MKHTARAALSLVAVAALALAGCSTSNPGGTSGGQSSTPATENIALDYMIWDANAVAFHQGLADQFHAANPNITVTVSSAPWDQYWTKMQTQATSNTLPDIFWINEPNFVLYAENGVLAALPSTYEKSAFPEALVNSYTLGGKILAAPMSYNTMAIWYNTALFDKAGVAYPSASWTLDDFKAAANAIHTALKDDGVFGAASGPDRNQETYYNTIFAAGGYVISDDMKSSGYADPGTIEGLKVWTDLIQSGAAPTVEQLNDSSPTQYFTSGKLAMMWSGGWNGNTLSKSEIASTIKVAPLPHGKGNRLTTIQGGAYAVAAGSKHLEAAQKFQEFLVNQASSEAFGKAGFGIPSRISAASTFTTAFPQWDLKIFIDQAAKAAPYPVSRDTAAWNKLEVEYLTPAWKGEVPVEQAAKDLADAMNKVLKEG